MMSFYFIDDDKNICNILKLIINERGLGVCCGSANNAAEALEDLPSAKPDIVIVDLLMPEIDGISFVKQARKIVPDASYIMLSQVSSKDMIASAYEAGIEFFIQKPINSVEVEVVIKKVSDGLSMKRMVRKMQNIFMEDTSPATVTIVSRLRIPFAQSLQESVLSGILAVKISFLSSNIWSTTRIMLTH